MFNTAVNYLVESRGLSLQICKLDSDSLYIRAYANASFAINPNLTSQLGSMALPCDKWDNDCTLHYDSCKSLRVAPSDRGAETYALTDAYDFAYCAKRDLETTRTNCPIKHDQLSIDQTRGICNIGCTTCHSAISSKTALPCMLRKKNLHIVVSKKPLYAI